MQTADSGTTPRAQALLDALGDAVVVTSESGVITAANLACGELLGYAPGELLGRSVEVLLPERHREVHASHRVTYNRRPWTRPMGSGTELTARHEDGTEIPVEVSLSPVHEGDGPSVVACIRPLAGPAHDQSTREATARASVLVEISWALAGGDPAAFDLASLRVAERIGDVCTISVRAPGAEGRLDPVAVHHPDPRVAATVRHLLTVHPLRAGEGISGNVVTSGTAAVVTDAVAERVQAEHRQVAEDLDVRAAMSVPIQFDGRTLGAVATGRMGPGPGYTADDRAFLEAVAATVARALPLSHAGVAPDDRSEAFLLLAMNAADVIYRVRLQPEPVFEYVSPSFERTSGHPPAGLYADAGLFTQIAHFEDRTRARRLLDDPPAEEATLRLRWVRQDRTMVWTEHRLTPSLDAAGRVVALDGIARDVTASVALEEVLAYQATHDPLTGLANRRLFFDRLERALTRLGRRTGTVAVLLVDLDRFKAVNDECGHAAGDDVLVTTADRLQRAVREVDTVARLGGDEFALVLETDTTAEAIDVAERVIAKCAQSLAKGSWPNVTASIGIAATTNDSETTPGELVGNADAALYRAKALGGGRWQMYDAGSS